MVSDKKLSEEYCHHCRRMTAMLKVESVSEITIELAEKVISEIAAEKSTNTANKALSKMKAALEYAKDRGAIYSNPIKKAKTLKTVRKKFRRDLTEEEVKGLLKSAPEPWRTIWHLLLATGIRRDELRYCRRSDLDLKKKQIRIYERVGFKPKTNAGSRTIPLGDSIIKALKNIESGSDLLFPSESGNPHNPNWMLDMFRRHISVVLGRIARIRDHWKLPLPQGVKKVNGGFSIDTSELDLHAMRYTFITQLIGGGVDPKTVQYLAGHKDIKTTLAIYAQFKGGNIQDAINHLPWA